VFDRYGRVSHMHSYTNETASVSGTIAERWSYLDDDYGRKDVASRSVGNSPADYTDPKGNSGLSSLFRKAK
jgi:hypothetical protein